MPGVIPSTHSAWLAKELVNREGSEVTWIKGTVGQSCRQMGQGLRCEPCQTLDERRVHSEAEHKSPTFFWNTAPRERVSPQRSLFSDPRIV